MIKKTVKELLNSRSELQSLESLERLQRLQSLETYSKDYSEIKIKEDSVIYCDIPYINTARYTMTKENDFDYDRFYSWCEMQKEPLFVSSYTMPEDRFVKIASFNIKCTLRSNKKEVCECIFVPRHQKDMISTETDIFSV